MGLKARGIALAVLFIGLLVAAGACAGKQADNSQTVFDLTIYEGESYEMALRFQVPAQTLTGSSSLADVEKEFDRSAAEMKDNGIDVKWRREVDAKDGSPTYSATFSGQGFQAFWSYFPGLTLKPVTSAGRPAVSISVSAQMLSGSGQTSSLTVHGAQVLQSNGTAVGRDTVHWQNLRTGSATAIVVPKAKGSPLPILLVVIGLVVLVGGFGLVAVAGGVAVYLVRRRRKQAAPGQPAAGNAA